jgi:subtilisin family serine protease
METLMPTRRVACRPDPFRPLIVLLLLALFPVPAAAEPAFVPGEVIVKYRAGSPTGVWSETAALLARSHALRRLDLIGAEHLRFVGISTGEAIATLRADPAVEYAEPNYLVYADLLPSDPRFAEQYALHNTGQGGGYAGDDIKAVEVWDLTTGAATTKVGVIDTGIDYTHPDLAANVWTNPGEKPGNGKDDDGNGYVDDVHGYDFVNGDGDPMDDGFHGTHVAGTIGAVGNNGLGVTGVNWQCQMVAIKFMDALGIGTEANAISSIQYAVALGLRVTNNSWGNMPYSTAMQDAIAAAGAAGQLLVFAAGNNRRDNDLVPEYPSSYDSPYIVSVAATDSRDLLATFSNYGLTSVDLGAPGWSILSTMPGATYATKDGTSMAAPHVSGVAALAFGRFPNASNLWIKQLILDAVDPVASLAGRTVTGGRLNAFRAITNGDAVVGVAPRMDAEWRVAPNPTRGGVTIELALPVAGPVALAVFDLAGRRVREEPAVALGAGAHVLRWDGSDDRARGVPAGVYLVRVETPMGSVVRRVVRLE